MTELITLPCEVIEKVKNTLKAYDEVHVIFEDGEFHVTTGVCIKTTYSADYEVIGTYKADDVYSVKQRILNYVNEFQCYPITYKGKRKYQDFHTGKREVFKWDGDNIVIA